LRVESSHMVQYSPARVFGARDHDPWQELPVPAKFSQVSELPADSQALQVAQLLRRCLQVSASGEEFHPNFAEAVTLHRTIEALVQSSKRGTWTEVA
jgi:predicted dehydrogenase